MSVARTLAFSFVALLVAACSHDAAPPAGAALADRYFLAAAPAGAVGVLDAHGQKALPARIAIRGRVKDLIPGRAAFTIIDASMKDCAQEGPMATCPTPWDFCCTDPTEVARATATVEVRDGGRVIAAQMRGAHGLDHLKNVVVEGTPARDEAGNLTLVATGIHVAP